MVPAPWARHAADEYRPSDDIGVHLTLNAEHAAYRWGPITHAPSLLSGEGGFPRDLDDLWEHADPDEVYRELKAQIERAMAWGIDVTHLAPHLTAITLRPEFFGIYLELAHRVLAADPAAVDDLRGGRRLPVPPARRRRGRRVPRPLRPRLARPARASGCCKAVADLKPGVTELHVQPAIDTPEVRALTEHAEQWIDDLALVTTDPALADAIESAGAVLIGYRELRDGDARARSALSSRLSGQRRQRATSPRPTSAGRAPGRV